MEIVQREARYRPSRCVEKGKTVNQRWDEQRARSAPREEKDVSGNSYSIA